MQGFDKSKYRNLFLEESEEMFGIIETILIKAEQEKNLENKDLNELFRAAHTLKGGASTVEFVMFTKYIHQLESFLDNLRSSKILFKYAMSDFLIGAFDTSKEILQLETNNELNDEIFAILIKELSELIQVNSNLSDDIEELPTTPTQNYGLFSKNLRYGTFKNSKYLNNLQQDIETDVLPFGFFDNNFNQEPLEDKDAFGFLIQTSENSAFGFFGEIDIPEDKSQDLNNAPIEQKQQIQTQKPTASSTIRVDLPKIDGLMNNVGEQVIGISMLYQFIETIDDVKIKNGLMERFSLLERHIRDIQESVMAMRMVPMDEIYGKFPKMIRDTAKKVGKQVAFVHNGDNVEIDKALAEKLTDPLMHIIRNAIDHGIESTEDRIQKSKIEIGTLSINAEQANGQILITISDDGKGIDTQKVAQKAISRGIITKEQLSLMTNDDICDLIFQAGLSTAEEITDLSGRGVGMDVVKSNIEQLGGAVKIKTEKDIGTKFIIALPLTLAILDGLNVVVGNSKYILPLLSIVESLQPEPQMIKSVGDGSEELLIIRDEFIPIVRLHKIFNLSDYEADLCKGILIVVKAGSQKLALFVDEFLHQQQVVIKPLDKNFKNVKGIGGATVRGDGSIGLILDIFGILDIYKNAKIFRRVA